MIGKTLAAGLHIEAVGRLVRQPFGRLPLPGKIVGDGHATAGGTVVGLQAVRNVEHDIALVGLTCALLLQILDLEDEVVAERAVKPEQRLVTVAERRDDGAHERHDRGAPGALLLVGRRVAAQDAAGDALGRALGDDHAGLAQRLIEE